MADKVDREFHVIHGERKFNQGIRPRTNSHRLYVVDALTTPRDYALGQLQLFRGQIDQFFAEHASQRERAKRRFQSAASPSTRHGLYALPERVSNPEGLLNCISDMVAERNLIAVPSRIEGALSTWQQHNRFKLDSDPLHYLRDTEIRALGAKVGRQEVYIAAERGQRAATNLLMHELQTNCHDGDKAVIDPTREEVMGNDTLVKGETAIGVLTAKVGTMIPGVTIELCYRDTAPDSKATRSLRIVPARK